MPWKHHDEQVQQSSGPREMQQQRLSLYFFDQSRAFRGGTFYYTLIYSNILNIENQQLPNPWNFAFGILPRTSRSQHVDTWDNNAIEYFMSPFHVNVAHHLVSVGSFGWVHRINFPLKTNNLFSWIMGFVLWKSANFPISVAMILCWGGWGGWVGD